MVLQYRRFVWEALAESTESIMSRQQTYAVRARQQLVSIPNLTPLQQHGMVRRPEKRPQIEPLCHSNRESNVLAGSNEALPPERRSVEQIALFTERRKLRELHQIRPFRIIDGRVRGTYVYRLELLQGPALDGAELVFMGDARKVGQLEADRLGGHRAFQFMRSMMDMWFVTPPRPRGREMYVQGVQCPQKGSEFVCSIPLKPNWVVVALAFWPDCDTRVVAGGARAQVQV